MNKVHKPTPVMARSHSGENEGGTPGRPQATQSDGTDVRPGQDQDTQPDMVPEMMQQVANLLRVSDRKQGIYTAKAIADACTVNESTVRKRWAKSVNSELANERALKADNDRYTELAMELFLHLSSSPLNPAEWVLQVLRPAVASQPNARQDQPASVAPNHYAAALVVKDEGNDEFREAVAARKAQLKMQRDAESRAQSGLSNAELERIRLEEEMKALSEIEIRDRIRAEVRKEMGLL